MKDDRQLNRAALAVARREQLQMANYLHESLCQSLVGVSLLVRTLLNRAKAGKKIDAADLAKISGNLEDAIDQSRLPFLLQAIPSASGGLARALGELARLTDRKVRCKFRLDKKIDPSDPQHGPVLFQIAEEAVRNAMRHAQAKKIDIRLAKKDGRLLLEIRDDGIGFDPAAPAEQLHGIDLQHRYADTIGAKIRIESKPKAGTRVICTLRPSGLAVAD